MRNRVTWLEIVILVCICAVSGIFCGIWAYKYYNTTKPKSEDNKAYFSSVYAQKKNDFSQVGNNSSNSGSDSNNVIIDEGHKSVYQMLSSGERVNLLVLGDETCTGYQSETATKWIDTLEKNIEAKYGSNVQVTSLAKYGGTALQQYYEFKQFSNNVEYDMIIVSVGANDRRTDSDTRFDSQYEALIRTAKAEYPNAEIITVIHNAENGDSLKVKAIRDISAHYNADCVDMSAVFASIEPSFSEEDDEEAISYVGGDGFFPNDAGYELYVEETMSVIENCVESAKKTTQFPDVLYEETEVYDSYQLITLSSMTQTSPGVYEKTIKSGFDVLSIAYAYTNPGGEFRVFVNGAEQLYRFTNSDVTEYSCESVAAGGFEDSTTIRVEIVNTASMPKIYGIILSGIDE